MPQILERGDTPDTEYMRQMRDALLGEWSADPYPRGDGEEGEPFGSLDSQMADEEDLYFQRFSMETINGLPGFRTGSAASDADAAIDSLMPVDVLVDVRKRRDRKKYEKQAEILKLFARSLIRSWKRPRNEFRRIISDQVIRRVGICRVLYDDTLFPAYPDDLKEFTSKRPVQGPNDNEVDYKTKLDAWHTRRDTWQEKRDDWEVRNRVRCPIIIEQRNPRQTRWREYRGELQVVVEQYQARAFDVQAAYEDVDGVDIYKSLRGRDTDDILTVSDIWFGEWRCILVEDQPIFNDEVVKHGYPRPPYYIFPFRELPFENPALKYRGMLTNSRDLYPMESQVLTMNVYLLAWNAWRSWKGHFRAERQGNVRIVPGEVTEVDIQKGEYLEMMDGRPVPPELLQMASVVDSYIQRNGVSQGPRTVEGTRSGTQVWAIQAMRQMKIEAAKEFLQIGLEDILWMSAWILENMIKEPITLPCPGRNEDGEEYGEITIGPDDINGYYDGFEISFSRRLDPALIEQAKELMAMSVNNWMPMKVSYQYSGLTDNPQEWVDMLLEQATDRMDFMLEYAALERIRQTEGEDSEAYKLMWNRVFESHQQGQQQGQNGTPGNQPSGGPGMPSRGQMTGPAPTGPVDPAAGQDPRLALANNTRPRVSARPRGQGRNGTPPFSPATGTPGGGRFGQ